MGTDRGLNTDHRPRPETDRGFNFEYHPRPYGGIFREKTILIGVGGLGPNRAGFKLSSLLEDVYSQSNSNYNNKKKSKTRFTLQ